MIKIIAKAVRIMNLFSAMEPRLSVSEVARRMEIPKSTAHNILKSLAAESLIERCGKDAYALGTGIVTLTQKVRVNLEVRDRAAPHVRTLADRCGESVYLTVRDGDGVLYVYAVESSRRLRARTAIGDRGMLHCTGVGKALLGRMTGSEIEALVARTGLPPVTRFTMTSPAAVITEAVDTATRGYSFDRQENELGNFCIGATFNDATGCAVGACSVSGTDPEIVRRRAAAIAPALVEACQAISTAMGWVPSKRGGLIAPMAS
jgi:DNA-binding IclR family transcriptional regulator